jgi:hypothetical protein
VFRSAAAEAAKAARAGRAPADAEQDGADPLQVGALPQLQCHGGMACCPATLVKPLHEICQGAHRTRSAVSHLCRERKRTKVDSLEGDVSALEAQIADLRVRQAENADLEQQNRCVPKAARSAM